ncbi:conserved hypothetical protein [Trichinella spiralis]|uniref:hypothetical protein n=1 Tax=Trichinella spiralis TaxID=6334 RepID=UPI0001EFEC0B|nr:conserved hypothetical protein [Trichinella spiralis]
MRILLIAIDYLQQSKSRFNNRELFLKMFMSKCIFRQSLEYEIPDVVSVEVADLEKYAASEAFLDVDFVGTGHTDVVRCHFACSQTTSGQCFSSSCRICGLFHNGYCRRFLRASRR